MSAALAMLSLSLESVEPPAALWSGAARTFVVAFFVFNALWALTLVPIRVGVGRGGSDGWRLWNIAKLDCREETIADDLDETDAHLAVTREDWAEARRVSERRLARKPDSVQATWLLASIALRERDYPRARTLYASLAERRSLPARARSWIDNNLAWTLWMLRDPALLDEAATLSEMALRALPSEPAVRGTRGTVLLAMGRTREAIPLLRGAAAGNTKENRALNECCLAVAMARLGDAAASRRHLDAAGRLDPACPLLDWALRECGGPSQSAYR
jgi:tetratricopeptide (TPR) repeat protein